MENYPFFILFLQLVHLVVGFFKTFALRPVTDFISRKNEGLTGRAENSQKFFGIIGLYGSYQGSCRFLGRSELFLFDRRSMNAPHRPNHSR